MRLTSALAERHQSAWNNKRGAAIVMNTGICGIPSYLIRHQHDKSIVLRYRRYARRFQDPFNSRLDYRGNIKGEREWGRGLHINRSPLSAHQQSGGNQQHDRRLHHDQRGILLHGQPCSLLHTDRCESRRCYTG